MKLKTDVKHDGPYCTLAVTVPGAEIAARFDAKLGEVAASARLPGFRPGKAPAALLRRRYGASLLGETLEGVMQESAGRALEDAGLRPSAQPDLDAGEAAYDLDALEAGRDLPYTLSFEPLPTIEVTDLAALSFERLTAMPEDSDVDEALVRLAEQQKGEGDAQAPAVDDALAQSLGQADLAALRTLLTQNLGEEIVQGARTRLKMDVMDALDDAHKFEAPPTMVEREFESIVREAEQHKAKEAGEGAEPEPLPEEDKAELRTIADRRVRLGILLAQIATDNNLTVSSQELQQAVVERAKMFPGHEEQMYNMIVGNQNMLESIRAPLLEDKAIDCVLELATVTERETTAKDIFADPEEEGEKAKPAAKKKAGAKKKPAAKKDGDALAKKKAPAKKKADGEGEPKPKTKASARKAAPQEKQK